MALQRKGAVFRNQPFSGIIPRMNRVVAILLLAMLMICSIPCMIFLFVVLFWPDDIALIIFNSLIAVVLGAGWIAFWRTRIRWTATRITHTALIAAAATLAATGFFFLMAALIPHEPEIGACFTGGVWFLTFLAGTAFVWRENAADRAARLRELGLATLACSRCGYNLTGITSAQCPECGESTPMTSITSISAVSAATESIPS